MQLQISSHSLRLDAARGAVLRCGDAFPLLYVGRGEEYVDMYRGNFNIEDYVVEHHALQVRRDPPRAQSSGVCELL